MCSEGAGRGMEGRGSKISVFQTLHHLFCSVIEWDCALRRPKSSLQLSDVLEHPV